MANANVAALYMVYEMRDTAVLHDNAVNTIQPFKTRDGGLSNRNHSASTVIIEPEMVFRSTDLDFLVILKRFSPAAINI